MLDRSMRPSCISYGAPALPDGVGKPAIRGCRTSWYDMFDCVLPTRSGRNGQAFVRAKLISQWRHAAIPRRFEMSCGMPSLARY